MSATSTMRVISAGSLAILMAKGEASEVINGARKVSNTSYMSRDSVDSQATIEIPEELESVKTLQFLELNAETAAAVFERYQAFEAQYPERASILHFAKDHVRSIAGDALLETDDWRGIMQRIGLTSNYQNRVMDPAWTHMRLNATAKETAIWMMEMRYQFLLTLDAFIQTPARGFQRKVSHLDLNGRLQPGRPDVPARGSSKDMGQPAVGKFNAAGSSVATKVQGPPLDVPGCQLFYKGGSIARLDKVNDTNGQLAFERLLSTPPGDFDYPTRQGLYITKQEQVAYQYAQWAQKVVDGQVVPVGIMRIAIPNHLLSSIVQVVGQEWQDYVWACRHKRFPPANLKYLADFQWLTGPLCHQSNQMVERMGETQVELTIWKMERGEAASQHVTLSGQMIELLNSNCVGKVWITNLASVGKSGAGGKK